MANYCYYNMKVAGKKENVENFLKIMQADYDYNKNEFGYYKHMGGRVFSAAEIYSYDEDLTSYCEIDGDCAWSVQTCMLDDEYSYYNSFKDRENCHSTNLIEESKYLKSIEVFSEEPGMCFSEHYVIAAGQVVLDECKDIIGHTFDTYDEYLEAYNNGNIAEYVSEENFDSEGYFLEDEFKDWVFDNEEYLFKPVLKRSIIKEV